MVNSNYAFSLQLLLKLQAIEFLVTTPLFSHRGAGSYYKDIFKPAMPDFYALWQRNKNVQLKDEQKEAMRNVTFKFHREVKDAAELETQSRKNIKTVLEVLRDELDALSKLLDEEFRKE